MTVHRYLFTAMLTMAAMLLATAPALATDCTRAEAAAADRQLWLNDRDKANSLAKHMPWGVPAIASDATSEWMLAQRDYVIRYDGDLRGPLFTAERVDAKRLGKVSRTDCFRADVRIDAPLASKPSDFDEAIFDQGHLAAFANQSSSKIAGNNSFVMSNMAPQTCQFNRGIWQILEGVVRLWATQEKTVFVISGSIFDRDHDGRRDPDSAAARMSARNHTARVAIPTDFYKIIARKGPDGRVHVLSLLLPHNQLNPVEDEAVAYLGAHIVTLDVIAGRTGLRFLSDAGNVDEASSLWAFDRDKLPGTLCHAAARADFDAIWATPGPVAPAGPGNPE